MRQHAPSACVVNLGCRVNRVESDRMSTDLLHEGFVLADEVAADVIVINTCAVTGEAEAKTRKAVRHALARPRCPWVVVTGCVVNLNAGELTALGERVVAEPAKARVAASARALFPEDATAGVVPQRADAAAGDPLPAHGEAPLPHGAHLADVLGRCRLGVKIQDGCNHRCSYCIVWKARGPEVSVPADDVVAEVRAAAADGVPEVVLTGVNLGRYRDRAVTGEPLAVEGLLGRILDETSVGRVRLSSIEPMDVSPALSARMAADPLRVAPFLHLPLQSGCTATLRRMRRPYTGEGFLQTVRRLRADVPGIALSCDVIVGFPGETEAEFAESLALCEEAGFSRMHVFRYSARPGTPAAEMPGQVDPQVMAERSARMRELADRLARRDAAARAGTRERAVVEAVGADGSATGTLGSFHRALIEPGADLAVGDLVDVAIMGLDGAGRLTARSLGRGHA